MKKTLFLLYHCHPIEVFVCVHVPISLIFFQNPYSCKFSKTSEDMICSEEENNLVEMNLEQ